MQVHVASATVVGGKMKDDVNAFHCGARDARLAEIGFGESDALGFEMLLDIAEAAACKVVNNMNFRTATEKLIDEMRSDK